MRVSTLALPTGRLLIVCGALLAVSPLASVRAADQPWTPAAARAKRSQGTRPFRPASHYRLLSGWPLIALDLAELDDAFTAPDPQPQANYPDLTVDASAGNSPLAVTADAAYNTVYVGNTSTGVVNHSAGTLTAYTSLYVGNGVGSNGTYSLTGGALAVTGFLYAGYNGTGSVVQSGTSAVTVSHGNTDSRLYLGYNTGSVGTYSLTDSATLAVDTLFLGLNSAGANAFTQSGGSSTFAGAAYVGYNSGAVGTLNLSGGTLTAASLTAGYFGTGVVNQTGGTLNVNGALILGRDGMRNTTAQSNGVYNLSAGSLSVSYLTVAASNNYLNSGSFVQSGASTVTAATAVNVGYGAAAVVGSYSLADTAQLSGATLTVSYNSDKGMFTQTGGTASFTTAAYLGSSQGSKGTANLSAGSFSTPDLYDGYTGTGDFTQRGTSTVTTTTVHLGPNGFLGPSAFNVGTYSLADAAVLTGATLYVGEKSSGANAFNQSGGSASFSSAIWLAYNTGSIGTLNLSGGTLSTGGALTIGNYGTGTVSQTGGTFTVGTGGVQMGVLGNTSSGVYTLSGGTLVSPTVTGAVGSTFNFNGGILQAATDSTAFFSVSATNVQAGGARINTNGHAITVAQVLAHDSALGATADGGFRKSGSGTLTLTGASTFTGPTTVNAGTLALNAGTSRALGATGSATVNTGGTLLLGAANQINGAAPLNLNAASGPGTGAAVAVNTGGFSQTLGALTLASTSVIDLGGGASVLRFAASGSQTWTGILAVWNWTGTGVTGGGVDQLIFGTGTTSLTNAQLAQIQFYGDGGVTALAAAGFASGNPGEVVPGGLSATTVPEPGTWLGGALVLGAAARGGLRRRLRRRYSVRAKMY